jgi:hypothetical protein
MTMRCLTREILLSQNEKKKKDCHLEVAQEISFLQKNHFSYASEFYFFLLFVEDHDATANVWHTK